MPAEDADLFFQPQQTAYDLNFSLFGFPVRVNPFFWLIGAFLGWSYVQLGFEYLAIFIGCFFVSILVHELGHAVMFRAFGTHSSIWLYGFGGLAIPNGTVYGKMRRIIVSLAGPFAGFILLGLLILTERAFHWTEGNVYLVMTFSTLYFMNLFYGLFNLIPIYPLDGGQVAREIFTGVTPRKGIELSLMLSILLAGVLAVHGLMSANGRPLLTFLPFGGYFMAIMFGMLAFENYQMLQAHRHRSGWNDGPSWGR